LLHLQGHTFLLEKLVYQSKPKNQIYEINAGRTMGANELEAIAVQKAQLAVRLDQEGKREEALKKYEEVIVLFTKIYEMVGNDSIKKAYLELISRYKSRAEELKSETPIRVSIHREEVPISSLMTKRTGAVKWDDVIGLDDAKRAVKNAVVWPFRRPDLYKTRWNKNILLFGPPGCGKTHLAAAVAYEIEADFYEISPSTLMSHLLGESEKNLAKVFRASREIARKGRSVVLFIDEIESIIGSRELEIGGEVRVKNQLLTEMGGLTEKENQSLFLYIVGATNKPWSLDAPFIRRFDKRVFIGPPDPESRLLILKLYSREMPVSADIDFQEIASLAEGYSGDDIAKTVTDVHDRLRDELFEQRGGAGEIREAKMDDFLWAMSRRRPSVNQDLVQRYQRWFEEHGSI
jgi:SpoVK/Ycf46/Vps4 family AAA+-type ATPase